MSHLLTDEQQQAIATVTQNEFKRLKILAYAGAGKTTTISLMAHKLAEQGLCGIYLAFNKAIADEAGRKMPPTTVAKTFHSLAYNNVSRNITSKLREGEGFFANTLTRWLNLSNRMTKVTGDATQRPNGKLHHSEYINNKKRYSIVKNALNLFMRSDDECIKNWHIDVASNNTLNMKLDAYSISVVRDLIKPIAEKVWADFTNPNGNFRISHDVYLKMYALQDPIIDYDFILFDESQDTDKLMLGILAKQTTRIIFVGDPFQQIYDWRGAVDAMSKFEGQTAYLTKSFRFGEAIAEPANMLLSYLNAGKPLIGAGKEGFVDYQEDMPENIDAILARTNAGAINAALDYYNLYPQKHIHLELNGQPEEMLALFKALDDFEKDSSSNKFHETLVNFDNFDMLKEYCKVFPSDDISQQMRLYTKYGYPYLERTIKRFSSKNGCDVTVTTAHKSKGREWNYVMICDDFEESLMPTMKAKEPIERADARLLYVALTRPKLGLYINRIGNLLHYIENFGSGTTTQTTA